MDVWDVGAPEPEAGPSHQPIPLPTLPREWWESNHPSHREFYELDGAIAAEVSFQVRLEGTIPGFKNRKYTPDPKKKSLTDDIFLFNDNGRQVLGVKWHKLTALLLVNMVIHPVRPSNKVVLPIYLTRGEHKNVVMTKIRAVGDYLWVLQVNPFTGEVDTTVDMVKVYSGDCCSVRLKPIPHSTWKAFSISAYLESTSRRR